MDWGPVHMSSEGSKIMILSIITRTSINVCVAYIETLEIYYVIESRIHHYISSVEYYG